MLILGILTALTVCGMFLLGHYKWDFLGFILILVFGIALVVALIMLPCNYYGEKANIEKFKITKTTYEIARKNLGKDAIAERAAIQMDIAGQNRWLAKTKYWNDTIFDIWFPDAVMDLKPLQ